jgi:hypothetical protein
VPLSNLAVQGSLNHAIACQDDDYIFNVQLEIPPLSNTDLSWCGMISIHFPNNTIADFATINTDCVEYPNSQIQVLTCYIDLATRTIFVTIVPGHYNNGQIISIKTKGLAITNPCVHYNIVDNTQFVVNFYPWQNMTTWNLPFMTMDSRNMIINTLTFTK